MPSMAWRAPARVPPPGDAPLSPRSASREEGRRDVETSLARAGGWAHTNVCPPRPGSPSALRSPSPGMHTAANASSPRFLTASTGASPGPEQMLAVADNVMAGARAEARRVVGERDAALHRAAELQQELRNTQRKLVQWTAMANHLRNEEDLSCLAQLPGRPKWVTKTVWLEYGLTEEQWRQAPKRRDGDEERKGPGGATGVVKTNEFNLEARKVRGAQFEADNKKLRQAVEDLTEQVNTKDDQIDSFRKELLNMQAMFHGAHEELARAPDPNAERRENSRLQSELDHLQRLKEQDNMHHRAQVLTLSKELDNLKAEMEKVRQLGKNAEAENREVRMTLRNTEAECRQAQDRQMRKTQAELDRQATESARMERAARMQTEVALRDAEQRRHHLQSELDVLRNHAEKQEVVHRDALDAQQRLMAQQAAAHRHALDQQRSQHAQQLAACREQQQQLTAAVHELLAQQGIMLRSRDEQQRLEAQRSRQELEQEVRRLLALQQQGDRLPPPSVLGAPPPPAPLNPPQWA